MAEKIIESFEHLHRSIQEYSSNRAIFRGIKSVDFQLKPSVGRMKFICPKPQTEPNPPKEERIMFAKFKQRAVPYLEFTPADDWDWLTLAQHHGLPTRLLDWTLNPLVATYFAVEDDFFKGDSVVYVCEVIPTVDTTEWIDPFEVSSVMRFSPRYVTRRLVAQAGVFTIHPEPDRELKHSKDMDRLIIPNSLRQKLKVILYRYGMHQASLFPDLDGLAKHIKWLREA